MSQIFTDFDFQVHRHEWKKYYGFFSNLSFGIHTYAGKFTKCHPEYNTGFDNKKT